MSLFKSGIIIAFFTFISRLFGLVRELFIASLFGTSYIGDSVNVAFKLPNLFRRVFAEGAMQAVFIPIFNAKLEESNYQAKKFAGEILSLLLVSLITLTIIMQLLMPQLMLLIAPGFNLSEEKFELTIFLCRITMPYIIFISLVALFGGVLNSIGKYAVFAASPVIMNIVIIVSTYFLKPIATPAHAISYSIIIAGIVQLITVIFYMRKSNMFFWPKKIVYNEDMKNFFSRMIPASLGSGVMQLNLFISQSIASFIPGAVSILSYAERLYQFPLSIIGIAFGTVLLPNLSKLYKSGKVEEAHKVQAEAYKLALFLSLPCTAGIITLSYPIIHLIYERGAFTSADTLKTAQALQAFTIGLPAFILSKIVTPAFYANHDTKTPFKITLYSLSFNTILNIILMQWLDEVGIALGSSIAAWLNLWLLMSYAKRNNFYQKTSNLIFITKVLACTVCMSVCIVFAVYKLEYIMYNSNIITKITLLIIIICLAILIFLTLTVVTKAIDLSQVRKLYKKR
ncbi:MAG: Integral rane protein MviN [Rickettsiaceae bacterium]|nr:Integral rane protein MviN [Rickettsiaceae bacterium]